MRAEAQRCAATFATDIWLYTRDTDGTTIYNIDGSPRETVAHAGEKPAPSYTFNEDVLRALIAAASDVLPPDRAQARHLADAISVRDRLLTLTEAALTRDEVRA
jgi:hypothetical protein